MPKGEHISSPSISCRYVMTTCRKSCAIDVASVLFDVCRSRDSNVTMTDTNQQNTFFDAAPKDRTDSDTDGLPTFCLFETFTVLNIDKTLRPLDVKKFLCPEDGRQPYITVQMPSDKQGNTVGLAVVTAPKIYMRDIMQFDGITSKSQRKKRIVIMRQDGLKYLKASKWIKTDVGLIYSGTGLTEKLKLSPTREITQKYCLVDSGAYFTHAKFTSKKDIDKVIERAFLSGVEKIVVKSINVRHAMKAQKLTTLYPGIIYYTAGVCPSALATWKGETTVSSLRDLLTDSQCVALGVIGLDSSLQKKIETQINMFTAQVELACEMGKPIIVCENGMTDKILDILDRYQTRLPPVCINISNQREANVEKYYRKGFYLAITGHPWTCIPPTWMSDWLGNLSKDLDKSRIMLASDSPDCFPHFICVFEDKKEYFRYVYKKPTKNLTDDCASLSRKYCSNKCGRRKMCPTRNESLSLQGVAELASGCFDTTPKMLAAATRKSAYQFFKFIESDNKLSENTNSKVSPDRERIKRTSDYISPHVLFFIAVLPVLLILTYAIVFKIDTDM